MKATVSILVPDIGNPIVGAATTLARHLDRDFNVEVVGPDFGHGVCAMYRGTYPYRVVSTPHLYRWPDFIWESRRLERAVEGDCVIAMKACANTVPLALRAKKKRGAKALVYLDEWDGALYHGLSPAARRKAILSGFYRPLDDVYYPLVERLIPRLDAVLSTTTFLQRRFGGQIVHAGVDMDFFSPSAPDATERLKQECGIASGRNIVFGGVVRPHKGVELILDALVRIGCPDYRLVIVGPTNQHVRDLMATPAYAPYIVALDSKPKEQMPRYLDMADAIVLPLSDSLLARSQMPCKVFEAMAMAKPVIGSAVSDLPLILEDCGRVVPPDDAAALAEAIDDVLSNEQTAREMGRRARAKCAAEYGSESVRRHLVGIINNLL